MSTDYFGSKETRAQKLLKKVTVTLVGMDRMFQGDSSCEGQKYGDDYYDEGPFLVVLLLTTRCLRPLQKPIIILG